MKRSVLRAHPIVLVVSSEKGRTFERLNKQTYVTLLVKVGLPLAPGVSCKVRLCTRLFYIRSIWYLMYYGLRGLEFSVKFTSFHCVDLNISCVPLYICVTMLHFYLTCNLGRFSRYNDITQNRFSLQTIKKCGFSTNLDSSYYFII